MTQTIVIVGSLNADLVVRTERFPKPGETLHGSDLAILPGGKSANQAVAAGRLGGTVRMIGAVGDDGNGALLRDSVAAAGADTTHVAVREGVATGTAVITVDAAGENTIVISAGANGTLTPDDVPADAFDDAGVLGLCLEVSIDVVLAAARAAHAAGVAVLTNLSPFGDVPAELLELTDVLLVNEHEAESLGEHGVARSIVTRGGSGCVVHDGEADPVSIDAVRVEPVDTTGCGDAFMGSVALRLAAGDSLVDAARFAVGVGAYAATKAGAQASYPTTAELEAFLRAEDGPPGS
ncbi:ribokinase [Curtobacterium sp. PhB42]|uniref:ribokinase n=1 Tax=unclassified Curtobacterium TaxID=257496 RepID=UPI00104E42BA|nr:MULTISPECIES: ribokinase [unclassified Curtobacterium]TCU81702.1 ribokinase [Curtobacterium sp. PhB191]TDW48424.1 ribokinase [Curtobacterium sp. PhB42]TDW53735.1 ribokinase [Curtobacterium sp. PhB190]